MLDTHELLIEYGITSMGDPICAFAVEKLLKQLQKDGYNCAIKDSVKSLKDYQMVWGNGTIVPSNEFERVILKLKIK